MKLKQLILTVILASGIAAQAKTPVELYGRLIAKGGALYDEKALTKVTLRGMSMYWSSEPDGRRFFNDGVVRWLQSDWKVSVIRVPLAVERPASAPATSKGYAADPVGTLAVVNKVVDAAVQQGLYVIIDWHCPETNPYTSDAVQVFGDYAAKFKNVPNVMFEIWNEPTVGNDQVVTHANKVIAAIRAKGNKNLVIVGSNGFSSQPDQIGDVTDPEKNVAYTLHFYAGSGGHDAYRTSMTNAINKGRTVFVTEWGATTYDGNTYNGFGNSQTWLDHLEKYGVSSCNWDIGTQQANPASPTDNTVQGSAAMFRGVSPNGGWDPAKDLTPGGINVRNFLRAKNTGYTLPTAPADTFNIPADTLWPNGYYAATGIDTIPSTDRPGKTMGKALAGSSASYYTKATATGYFEVTYRVQPNSAAGQITLKVDNQVARTTKVASGSSWVTVVDTLEIAVLGNHDIGFGFSAACNFGFAKLRKILWRPPVGVSSRHSSSSPRLLTQSNRRVLQWGPGLSWTRARIIGAAGQLKWSVGLRPTDAELVLPEGPLQGWLFLDGPSGVTWSTVLNPAVSSAR